MTFIKLDSFEIFSLDNLSIGTKSISISFAIRNKTFIK
uniref:Uncharacterized protein n=1 Tax=Vibrio tasmaniensis TaxID=212663 RepID=A0A0H3ZQR7_9VIBR|nr:hypothetical protein [Vibrio tasmaniensis]